MSGDKPEGRSRFAKIPEAAVLDNDLSPTARRILEWYALRMDWATCRVPPHLARAKQMEVEIGIAPTHQRRALREELDGKYIIRRRVKGGREIEVLYPDRNRPDQIRPDEKGPDQIRPDEKGPDENRPPQPDENRPPYRTKSVRSPYKEYQIFSQIPLSDQEGDDGEREPSDFQLRWNRAVSIAAECGFASFGTLEVELGRQSATVLEPVRRFLDLDEEQQRIAFETHVSTRREQAKQNGHQYIPSKLGSIVARLLQYGEAVTPTDAYNARLARLSERLDQLKQAGRKDSDEYRRIQEEYNQSL